jgi:hypothetical protein
MAPEISLGNTPSPSVYFSLTHPHRSICYRNPHPLVEPEPPPSGWIRFNQRLMYLRVCMTAEIPRQNPHLPRPYDSREGVDLEELSGRYGHGRTIRILLAHTFTNHPPNHGHTPHDHIHSDPVVSFVSGQTVTDLQPQGTWPLGQDLLYVYPINPVYERRFRSLRFSV